MGSCAPTGAIDTTEPRYDAGLFLTRSLSHAVDAMMRLSV